MNTRIIATWRGFFIVTLFSAKSLAAQTSLNIGVVPGYPGATVSVPVGLRQPSGATVAAQFDVVFNATKAMALTALRGERLTNHIIRSRQVAPGVERVLIYSLNNAAMAGTNVAVAQVPFNVPATEYAGSGPLTPTSVAVTRSDAMTLNPVRVTSGAIFVRPANPRPDGVVDFFLPSMPDERYLVQATTNFVEWVNISTNVALDSFLQLVDLDAPHYPYRFYRSALFDALLGGQLSQATRLADGSVHFQFAGFSERNYTVEACTDLVSWEAIGMVTATGGTLSFTDHDAASYRQRFYRFRSD